MSESHRFISTGYLPKGSFIANPGAEIDNGLGKKYEINLDTDSSPYFSQMTDSSPAYGIALDTDSAPYFASSGDTYVIQLDTDSVPFWNTNLI